MVRLCRALTVFMENTTQYLYPARKDGKFGFINQQGQVVIGFEFDGAYSFSEGLAGVFMGGKVGFIDTIGNMVITPRFDTTSGFSEGFAGVRSGGKGGYVNRSGDFVIPPVFYMADGFENGLARVMKEVGSKGSFIDQQGKVVVEGRNFLISKYSEGLINCPENGNWGFIDTSNRFVVPPVYKHTREFSEGKAAVTPKKDINGKPNRKDLYGFINHQNEMIIPPLFQGADIRFSEGLCAVWDDGYGYIDAAGKQVIPCEFDLGKHFSEGMAVFKPKGKKKKYGYIDPSGRIVIEAVFTSAHDFKNGAAAVITGEQYEQFHYGLIDKKGNYIWEPSR